MSGSSTTLHKTIYTTSTFKPVEYWLEQEIFLWKSAYLLGQFQKEVFSQVRYFAIAVDNTRSQLTDLTFDLHHVIEDEAGQHVKGVLSHQRGIVTETARIKRLLPEPTDRD